MLSYLDKIKKAVEARPEELAKARQQGAKVVGYYCCYLPEEIIHALGLIPVRLCRGGDERLVDVGGRYVSKNNCVYIREAVGLFAEGKDPFVKNSDMVAVATTCLQIYRLSELINYFFGVPTHALKVPRSFYYPEGRKFFQKEMENFARKLEEFSGRKLTPEALKESVQLFQNIRQAILELYKFQAQHPDIISWKDVFNTVHAGFFLDREYYLSLLTGLLKELHMMEKEQGGRKFDVDGDERPRILISGTIIPPGDTKLIDMIERMGGRVVADDLCTGLRFVANLIVKEPSLAGIADAYLDRVPCASLPFPFPLETDRRLAYLSYLIDTYKPEGMIYHSLRYCDPFTFKANETKQIFKDKVAFLEIHTEYASSDVGALMTRIEAFMELIQNLRIGKKAPVA